MGSAVVAKLRLQNPLMNGAYIGSKSLEDALALIESSAAAVVVGSVTVKPRDANTDGGYVVHKSGLYSLNSFGMPNGGQEYFEEHLPAIVQAAHAKSKPVIVNVAGFSLEEYVQLSKLVEASGADMVELNLGCPNAWDGGEQKKILSYDPAQVKKLLDLVKSSNLKIKVCVKLSPLPPDTLQEAAQIVADSGCVHAVTATNSYPNASYSTGTGKQDKKYMGMTGKALKPISIGVVRQLRELLPEEIDIIGCGGISSKNDVMDYLEAGASAVQLATALVDEGVMAFDRILSE